MPEQCEHAPGSHTGARAVPRTHPVVLCSSSDNAKSPKSDVCECGVEMKTTAVSEQDETEMGGADAEEDACAHAGSGRSNGIGFGLQANNLAARLNAMVL